MGVVSFIPWGTRPLYPPKWRLGWPQTPGRCGEEKYVWLLPRIEPRFLGHTACSLVTLSTELYRVFLDTQTLPITIQNLNIGMTESQNMYLILGKRNTSATEYSSQTVGLTKA